MTQTAPPTAADGQPDRPWNLHTPLPEADHPTDTKPAAPSGGGPPINTANGGRTRAQVDLPLPTGDAVWADDPASIRMQELADERRHPWDRDADRAQAHASPPRPGWAQGLEDWWVNTATHDIENSIEKVVEYGGRGSAYDLIATGHDLASLNGRRVGDEEAVELAILSYLSSKVNRWFAAAIDGRRPSDDTLLDIAFYAMMARRNRAVGGWPVAPTAQ